MQASAVINNVQLYIIIHESVQTKRILRPISDVCKSPKVDIGHVVLWHNGYLYIQSESKPGFWFLIERISHDTLSNQELFKPM
jgi:hypothetical protein